MDHPDFRVRGKIFATLGYPDKIRSSEINPDEQRGISSEAIRIVFPAG